MELELKNSYKLTTYIIKINSGKINGVSMCGIKTNGNIMLTETCVANSEKNKSFLPNFSKSVFTKNDSLFTCNKTR